MSLRASVWAWQQDIPPNGKLVLLALADNAHEDGGSAFPSVATLARKTGYGTRQVQRILSELTNKGVVFVQRAATRHRPTTYGLAIDDAFALARDGFRAAGCPPALRLSIIERDGYACTLCDKAGDEHNDHDGHPWEVDRVRSGGDYSLANCRLTCRGCNRKRGQGRHPVAPADLGATNKTPRGDTGDVSGASPVTPEPSYEPPEEPGTTSPAAEVETLDGSAVATIPDRDDEFERFWSLYPRKVGKGAARAAFARATHKVPAPLLIAAASRFAGTVRELRYCPHPTTWLNQERWADLPQATTPPQLARPGTAAAVDWNSSADWAARLDNERNHA